MIITEEGNKKLTETNIKIKADLQNVSCKFSEAEIEKLQETLRAFRKNLEELVNMNI